jgi:hypothetical protein
MTVARRHDGTIGSDTHFASHNSFIKNLSATINLANQFEVMIIDLSLRISSIEI